jgi:hypothetical protein
MHTDYGVYSQEAGAVELMKEIYLIKQNIGAEHDFNFGR